MIKSSATLIFLLSTSLLAKKSLNDVKIVRYTDKQACFEAKPCENKLTLKNVEKLYGKKVQINYISNLPGLKDYSSKKVKQLREEDILQFFKKEKDSFSLTVTAEPGTKSHFGITFSDIYKKLSEKIIYARSKASISNEALDMSKIKYKKNEKVPIAFLDFMYKEDPVDIKVYKSYKSDKVLTTIKYDYFKPDPKRDYTAECGGSSKVFSNPKVKISETYSNFQLKGTDSLCAVTYVGIHEIKDKTWYKIKINKEFGWVKAEGRNVRVVGIMDILNLYHMHPETGAKFYKDKIDIKDFKKDTKNRRHLFST